MLLSLSADFSKLSFLVSNSLDQDQDRHSVNPDLSPKCLQRLSADDLMLLAIKERVNI